MHFIYKQRVTIRIAIEIIRVQCAAQTWSQKRKYVLCKIQHITSNISKCSGICCVLVNWRWHDPTADSLYCRLDVVLTQCYTSSDHNLRFWIRSSVSGNNAAFHFVFIFMPNNCCILLLFWQLQMMYIQTLYLATSRSIDLNCLMKLTSSNAL